MRINTNYQFNFTGLVPISEYKGKPRLTPKALEQLNQLKKYLKDIKEDILDIENQIHEETNNGLNTIYLKRKLDVYNDSKERYELLISEILRNGKAFKGPVTLDSSNIIKEQLQELRKTLGIDDVD